MAKSDTLELFEDFFNSIKGSNSIEDTIAEWGGVNIAVPSFTGAIRDKKIYDDFLALNTSYSVNRKYTILARKYNLSTRKIQKLVSELKDNKTQKGL